MNSLMQRRATQSDPIRLNPSQLAFFRNTAQEVLMDGPRGTGKSTALIGKAIHVASKHNADVLICRKSYQSLMASTTMQHLIADPSKKMLPDWMIQDWHKQQHCISLTGGGRIWYTGLDKDSHALSKEFAWIGVEEAREFTEKDWTHLKGTLRGFDVPYYQIAAVTNPWNPNHFLYKYFYENGDKVNKKGKRIRSLIQSKLDHNMKYLHEDYIQMLDDLPGKYRDIYRLGLWTFLEGMIFSCFDAQKHIVTQPFEIPSDWQIVLGIDFGFNHPFVCQWWAIDPKTDRCFLYREIYKSNDVVTEYAKIIKSFPDFKRVSVAYCDHSKGEYEILRRAGIPCVPAVKGAGSVVSSIQDIYMRMSKGQIHFFPNAVCHEPDLELKRKNYPMSTVDEIPGYYYKAPDKPQDEMDDGCKAMMYALYSYFLKRGGAWADYHSTSQKSIMGGMQVNNQMF